MDHEDDRLDTELQAEDASSSYLRSPKPKLMESISRATFYVTRFRRSKQASATTKLNKAEILIKVGNSGKLKEHMFRVDKNLCLAWEVRFGKRKIALSRTVELRLGQRTPEFEKMANTVDSELCFSILYYDGLEQKSLNLICKNSTQFDEWVPELLRLMGVAQNALTGDKEKDFVLQKWMELDVDNDNRLDRREVVRLFMSLNIEVGTGYIYKQFKKFDTDMSGYLEFNEFYGLLESLRSRVDIEDIFRENADTKDDDVDQCSMSIDRFHLFIKGTQKEDLSLDEVKKIAARFSKPLFSSNNEPNNEPPPVDCIRFHAFLRYLRHDPDSAVDPKEKEMWQDMTRPLSDYFISSSHNTYLMGDQLLSQSSVEMYIRCFRMGVRSVELDLWDGPDGEPIIRHGGTATSSILAEEVVKVVRDFAFRPLAEEDNTMVAADCYRYDLPVILSLENHCSPPQQKRMAHIFTSVLAHRLALPENEETDRLKSPLELRGKVLLKGKRSVQRTKKQKSQQQFSASSTTLGDDDLFEEEDGEVNLPEKKGKKKPKAPPVQKICKELSDITYLQGFKMHSWDDSWEHGNPSETSSFGNVKLTRFTSVATKVIRHNLKHLSRTYPSPAIDAMLSSANYDPVPFWSLGCQLVSLNMQTHDRAQRLNHAQFVLRNGNCGYVVKPDIVREPHPTTGLFFDYNDNGATRDSRIKPLVFTIQVISAQQLPKYKNEVIDPFVQLELIGTPRDRKVFRTRTVPRNGFNPVWGESFEFVVNVPELAFLSIEVKDLDITTTETSVAFHAIPITLLRQGYRQLALRTAKWVQIPFSTLFVHISLRTHKAL